MSGPAVERIPVDEGVVLETRRWTGGESLPVLAVHGLASNARTWEQVAGQLAAAGHPVAAVDLRGHGRSDRPPHGYDFSTLGRDLLAVLDRLDWDRAAVAGQSTGGNLALHLALAEPRRVAAIVGVDGGLLELADRWAGWDDCARDLAPPPITGRPCRELETWIRRAHPDWSDASVEATLANFEVRADGSIGPWLTLDRHLAILRSLWEHRPSTLVAGLSAPALFLLADTGDDWTRTKRAEADRALALSPRLRIEWFSPGDHDLHLSEPEAVAGLMVDFLAAVGD